MNPQPAQILDISSPASRRPSLVFLTGRGWCGLILTVLLFVAAGCQNRLSVRVEKLDGVMAHSDGEWDDLLGSVQEALRGLNQLSAECRRAYGDAATAQAVCPLPAVSNDLQSLLPLAESLAARRASGQLSGRAFAAQVEALRRRTVELLPALNAEALQGLIAMEVNEERRLAMIALAQRLPGETAGYAARLAPSSTRPGFGGFRQAGVYQINPGDPHYDAVLKATPAPHPLTAVTAQAAGDCGVMIVQESPGQFRLYQISNDPAAILRNAALIMDKVMQAAVKFQTADNL